MAAKAGVEPEDIKSYLSHLARDTTTLKRKSPQTNAGACPECCEARVGFINWTYPKAQSSTQWAATHPCATGEKLGASDKQLMITFVGGDTGETSNQKISSFKDG